MFKDHPGCCSENELEAESNLETLLARDGDSLHQEGGREMREMGAFRIKD